MTNTLLQARDQALALLAEIEDHERRNAERHHSEKLSLVISAKRVEPILRALVEATNA